MNIQNKKKLSIKYLLSIVGIAGASVVMSFPAFAQVTPSSSDSPSSNQQMTGERKPTDDRSMQEQTPAGSQQMNTGTSNTSDRQTTTGTTTVETQQYNRSTTSQQANPNGVTPTTTPSAVPTDTPAVTPTDTPSTTPENTTSPAPTTNQQAPDQGVRALW